MAARRGRRPAGLLAGALTVRLGARPGRSGVHPAPTESQQGAAPLHVRASCGRCGRVAAFAAVSAVGLVAAAVLGDGYFEIAKHVWLAAYLLVVTAAALGLAVIAASRTFARRTRASGSRG